MKPPSAAIPAPSPIPEPEKKLLEADVEKAGCDYAKKCGIWQRKFLSPNNRAEPDRVHMVSPMGWVFFIEYKRPGKAATFPADAHEREQARKHREIREAGGTVYVVDNEEDAKRIMDSYAEARKKLQEINL